MGNSLLWHKRLKEWAVCCGLPACFALFLSCSGSPKPEDEKPKGEIPAADVLLQYGDTVLTIAEVKAQIPAGISSDDSIALFQSIANEWLAEQLLFDAAEANFGGNKEIEERVEAYRRRLLLDRYRQSMARKNSGTVPKDSVEAYYEQHGMEYKLDRPLVKGIFIKMPSGSSQLEQVKKWMAEATPRSLDNIEKYAMSDALQYEYFMDSWQEWDRVIAQFPSAFAAEKGANYSGRDFETAHGGSTYLLHLSSYRAPGSQMPYEYAIEKIRLALEQRMRSEADRNLIEGLRQKALIEGKLTDNR